jgi:hypothetical protein
MIKKEMVRRKKRKWSLEKCSEIALGRGYEVISKEYLSPREKLIFKHLKENCNCEFGMTWDNFNSKGQNCPKCAKNQKYVLEDCIKESVKLGYKILSKKYVGVNKKLKFLHLECGKNFYMDWSHFNGRKQRCPHCYTHKKPTIKECKTFAKKNNHEIHDDKYLNCELKMNFTHLLCGSNFGMRWNDFKNGGQRCPICAGKIRLTLGFCKKFAKKRKYELLSKKYKNNSIKLKFKHLKCKKVFYSSWSNFSQGKGCPTCAREQQESLIATKLKKYLKNKYKAKSEWKECLNPKTGRFLPYDIYFEKNNKKFYVEVQGSQHYSFNVLFHRTLKEFEYSLYKDRIKMDFAISAGVYVEIDLRKIKTIEKAILEIENMVL